MNRTPAPTRAAIRRRVFVRLYLSLLNLCLAVVATVVVPDPLTVAWLATASVVHLATCMWGEEQLQRLDPPERYHDDC